VKLLEREITCGHGYCHTRTNWSAGGSRQNKEKPPIVVHSIARVNANHRKGLGSVSGTYEKRAGGERGRNPQGSDDLLGQ